MQRRTRKLISILFLLSSGQMVLADPASDIQALKDAKALLDAQVAKDVAEAAALKAASDLQKAKAAAANAARDIQQSQAAADEKALLDAQAAKDTAEAAAIKASTELLKAKAAAAIDVEQSQAAANAKTVLDAQAAKDTAEAAAISATTALAKAKATSGNVSNEIRKEQYAADAALTKAEVGAQTAELLAIKEAFGNVPSIGSDGSISITDATTGVLLQVKAGSLAATWGFAENLCTILKQYGVKNAFIPPVDLDTKIQSARMVLREFTALDEKVQAKENRDIVGLEGAEAQFAAAAALSAVSLLQYGAGALQSVAKLFRSDYAVALSTDATRSAWLEYFMVARCPDQVPRAQMEAVVRKQSIDEAIKKLDQMQDFYNAAVKTKSSVQKQIDLATAKITELKANKQDPSIYEEQLQQQNEKLSNLGVLDAWLPRVQSLINAVSANPATFLDALTWYAFGDDKNVLKISSKPRLSIVLTTQDGQVTRTFWLTGKTMYGKSAGELIYRVQNPDGSVSVAGYVTATTSTGKVHLSRKGEQVTDLTHVVKAELVQ